MQDQKNKFMKVTFVRDDKDICLENKKCILLVSTGQKYHEGDRLSGTIDLINKSNFSSCTIAVADTLQRHNFPDKSPEEAYRHSLQIGDDWLSRNEAIINKLIPNTQILRWDAALQDENYAAIRKKIDTEYAKNKNYRDAVNATISTFTARVIKRVDDIDLDAVFSNCLKYLIEECPIIMPLWASQGFDFVIYPKPMTKAMQLTQEIFVKNDYPTKGKWLSLKFKKLSVPANERQQFKHLESGSI